MDTHTPALTATQYLDTLARTLARFLACKSAGNGSTVATHDAWSARFPRAIGGEYVERHKTTIGAGGIPLGAPPELSRAFVRSVEPLTALGRLTPRRVPFNLDLSIATAAGGAIAWTPAALPFPATALTFDDGDPLAPLKAGGILALTREAVELGATGAEQFVLDELRKSYVQWLDDALLNPIYTAIAGTRPASITSGATPITSAGSSVANMAEDARRLVASFTGQGGRLQTAVVLLSPASAVALRTSGHQAFTGLTIAGGDYAGIPAVTSEAATSQIVLLDQGEFYLADDGEADFDTSSVASLEMSDLPTQSGAAGTGVSGSSLVSLWQNNLRAIKVSRVLNWRADGAVAAVSGVAYAEAGSPA